MATLGAALVLLIVLVTLREQRTAGTRPPDASPGVSSNAAHGSGPAGADLGPSRLDVFPAAGSEADVGSVVMPEIPAVKTARQFLSEYYGAQWPAIEKKMVARGVNLDIEYVYSPWEEAAPFLEQQLASMNEKAFEMQVEHFLDWPRETTSESLEAMVPGLKVESEGDLQEILAIAAPFNEDLERLGESWATMTDLYVREKWAKGDYLRAPYTTIGAQEMKLGLHAVAPAGRGWAVQLVLEHEEYPDLVAMMDRMNDLIDKRNDALIRRNARR